MPRTYLPSFLATALFWLSPGNHVHADTLRIVADIAPVHSLVASVLGNTGDAVLLLPASASPHDHALRPSQAGALQDSTLIVFVSAQLTPWLADELPVLAPAATAIELMEIDGTTHRAMRDQALFVQPHHDDEHADEHADDGHKNEHADGHADGHDDEHADDTHAEDPHGWLDPANAIVWLDAIAEAASQLDPPNAGQYRDNASKAGDSIRAAQQLAERMLADVKDRPFVLQHDGLQHFEQRFGLTARAALSPSDSLTAGPRRYRAVRDTLASLDAPCLFIEAGGNKAQVAPLVDGLNGVKVASVDTLGVRLSPGPDLYAGLIAGLSDTVSGCLQR